MSLFERARTPRTMFDERDGVKRKYYLDYALKPGADVNPRKADSYYYAGYYYALNLCETKLDWKKAKAMYLVSSLLQLIVSIIAGCISSSSAETGWVMLPYTAGLLSAGMSAAGAGCLAVNRGERFVRRVRDEGALRFARWQPGVAVAMALSALAQLVWMVGFAGKFYPTDALFLVIAASVSASACYLWRFTAAHKPIIVHDGKDDAPGEG